MGTPLLVLGSICVTCGRIFKAFFTFQSRQETPSRSIPPKKNFGNTFVWRSCRLLIADWKALESKMRCAVLRRWRRGVWGQSQRDVEGKRRSGREKTGMLDFAYNCIYTKDCFEQKKTAPCGAVPSHDFFTVPGRWFHDPGDIPKRIKSCHDPQLCLL